MTRIENIIKNKTKYYACASEVQYIALERGEKINSYFQDLLKYLGHCTKLREYYKKGHQKTLLYIGMKFGTFKERLKEHLSDIKFNKPSAALSRLYQTKNIKINFGKTKMIISTSNHYPSIIRESIEILLRSDTVCNDILSYNISAICYNILGISRAAPENMN